MKFSRALRILLSLSLLALTAPLFAQQTGAISGKVTDTSGGVLPGVTVEARSNILPGLRATTTGSNGDYRLPALPPGEYTVTFTLSGMQTVTRKAYVQLAQEAAVDAKLGVGGLTEAVEVSASTSLIDKDTATVATGLTSTQLSELPTGTEYRDLMKLLPGVMYTQDSIRGQSVGGSGQDNVYNFDGVNVTLPLFGTLAAEPSSHDIAQVNVIKGGARAVDFDRSGGMTVDSVSKSGTDKFTGQIDYRLQTQDMTANLKSGTRTRYDQDRAWATVGLGGPILKDRLYFYGSYYRPTVDRENQANSYGALPAYNSTRNEGFGKLTFTPTSKVLLNASYRYSKRLVVSDQFAVNAAPTSGGGEEALQKIFTTDGSWVISPRSFATFKYTNFENPTGGRPDSVSSATPSITVGTRLDVSALDTLGRFSVPTPIAGDAVQNAFVAPLISRYGFNNAAGVRTGGGIVGFGLEFNDQDFFRQAGQIGYNITLGGKLTHDIHVGAQLSEDSEDLVRSSNGWGLITAPGGRTQQGGVPVFYQATFSQQAVGTIAPIHSEYKQLNLEFNDTIRAGRWTFNLGLITSKDTLYGQDLKDDSSTLSGYTFSRGSKYTMYELGFKKMIQPRLGATWAYNGEDTLYAGFAQYKPAASSLPRAASWSRSLATARYDAYFDQNGVLFAAVPVAASAGKLFQDDLTPRTTDEYLLGTAKKLNSSLTARVYGRHRRTAHFWEDTQNNARQTFNPPAGIPRDPYIPDLVAKLTQINAGTTAANAYVIAELDGAYTRYWEGSIEIEWQGSKGQGNLSYTRSRYYGNFDQDNTTTVNDAASFMGSSFIGDGPGRQVWDLKDGTLRGDRPHMLKASGSWRLSWKATVGAFFVAQSGQPWEMWSYEPYRALTTSTSNSNRYAEKAGSRRSDSHHQLDFNYTQDLKLKGSVRLQLVANVFNVYNKQTGYNIQPEFNSSLFGQPRNYYDPRRLELTARLRF